MDARHIRILIAEDERIIALDIKNILDKSGYKSVTVVSNGDEALKIISSEKADLVLMDIHLGQNENGIEIAGIIKEKYSVPVIYLTALADDETFQKANRTEPSGFILKPFDEKTLLFAIESAILKKEEPELKKKKTINKKKLKHGFNGKNYIENITCRIKGGVPSRLYENVTILFSDFEAVSENMDDIPPDVFLHEVNDIFMQLDIITRKQGLVKIRPSAEMYMISSGSLNKDNDQIKRIIMAAIEMLNYLDQRNRVSEYKWTMHVSINSRKSDENSGIINKGFNDIWGEEINTSVPVCC